MNIDARLEEAVLAYLFGGDDGAEDDPGALVSEAARAPGFDAWARQLAADLPTLRRAVGADPAASVARARLAALQHEVAHFVDSTAHSRGANAASGAAVVSLDARRRERRRTYALVGTFAALAAGLLVGVVALDGGPAAPSAPRPTVAQAKGWVEALDDGGLAFAGGGPSARQRGFMLAVVRDLSAPSAEGVAADSEALEAARLIAERAAAGLGRAGSAEELRVEALEGCRAWLEAADELAECELGLGDYARKRDAELAPQR